jgi:signal transduction histidine kinase
MKKRKSSIRIRLFLSFSSLIISVIGLIIILNSLILEYCYIYSKASAAKETYKILNNLYNNENLEDFDDKILSLKKVAMENNYEFFVVNSNGEIENSSYDEPVTKIEDEIISQDIPTEIKRSEKRKFSFDNKESTEDRVLKMFDTENYQIQKRSLNGINSIILSGKLDNGYRVYIQIPYTSIEKGVEISNNLLLVMGTIAIIIAAIIASFISRKFSKPIRKLNSIANKMSKLDFEEKYEPSNIDDEINQLGTSINVMSDKLETTIKRLRENNSELERDIQEKTKIDEMRKQFISDVSHELKTPIALIQGYAEGLVEVVNNDPESRKYYAEVILDETNKMDRLVKNLLELMRLEYGKRDFNNEEYDIVEQIKEVLRQCDLMIKEKNIKVIFNEKKKIIVYADPFYMEQAITNYITNAIRHAIEINRKKEIRIKLEVNEKEHVVRFIVQNTGGKLSEDTIEKLWDRFYKVDSSRNRNDGGSGVGLSIVKAIINNYDNKYGVKNIGDGVEFYFDIDLVSKKEEIENKNYKDNIMKE